MDEEKQIGETISQNGIFIAWEYPTNDCPCVLVFEKTEKAVVLLQNSYMASGYITLLGYRKQSDTAEEIRRKMEAQGRFEFFPYNGKEYLTIETDKFNQIMDEYIKKNGVEVDL